jgi:PAS domain S-box-containing protein
MSTNKPYIWHSADSRLITTEQVNTIIGLGALFEYATEGILVTDNLGNIVMANPSAERIFGYEKGELPGKKIEVLIPRRLSGSHEKVREGFNKKPEPRAMGTGRDLFATKKDGTEFPVEVSLSPFESANGKFVIAFVIDITVRKQSEEVLNRQRQELERVSGQIKQLNIELERKVEDRTTMLRETLGQLERSKNELSESLQKEKELGDLKSRFVSTVSHEFRTPLGAILSSAYLLEKYIQKHEFEKTERHLSKITESVRHMNAMLEDLLSLGKLEEGLIQAKSEEFDFRKFITDLVTEMQELARKGQKIKLDVGNTGLFSADKRLLKNVLLNLVSNAIKFSEEDGVIEIKCKYEDGNLIIAVSDMGIGISEADQEHLFERFFRAQNAANIQGTGLGLHIISRYLELLEGSIDIKSELAVGSTFTVTIPSKQ